MVVVGREGGAEEHRMTVTAVTVSDCYHMTMKRALRTGNSCGSLDASSKLALVTASDSLT